jgi:hypothetical protein
MTDDIPIMPLPCSKCGKTVKINCECQVDKYLLLVQDLVSKEWVLLGESTFKEAIDAEYKKINDMGDTGPKLIIFTGDYPTL